MSLFIYLISFLEGFTTLSIEIIAIRNFTPIIGTNSISTSIILGVILLALSYGYYIGGKNTKGKTSEELKNKIILNLLISSAYYLFFTFVFDQTIVSWLLNTTNNYFISVLVSSIFLFFIPVFYASQTIPLLSEILRGDNTGEKIGKLLFFSTIGSFFGSVLTSTVLFATIGVANSATLNSVILSGVAILLIIKGFKKIMIRHVLVGIIFILSLFLLTFKGYVNPNIIYNTANSYHNIIVYEENDKRIFFQNSGFASGIDINTKESYFEYIKEIKGKILENNYRDIAIIGAAGFTLPQELARNNNTINIDLVDVDKDLKEISEKYFLQEKIDEKINFIVEPCRYFINNKIEENKKYDAIVIDIYVGNSLAPQTLTLEFFEGLKKIADDIYINLITDTTLESKFSKKAFNTMQQAFGEVYYKDTNLGIGGFKTNFVVTNKAFPGYKKYIQKNDLSIYTDNKNSIEIDLFEIIR